MLFGPELWREMIGHDLHIRAWVHVLCFLHEHGSKAQRVLVARIYLQLFDFPGKPAYGSFRSVIQLPSTSFCPNAAVGNILISVCG